MTQKRRDNHSTEFGLWLREQKEIDSKRGYVATNLDFVWRNYKTGEWMLIEEKRYQAECPRWQRQMFAVLHRVSQHDPLYRGFYFIKFERTNPDDGKVWINGRLADRNLIIQLLQFKWVRKE